MATLAQKLRLLSIRDKQARQVPFRPNWAQKELIAHTSDCRRRGEPTRQIVLKARQLGVSTYGEGVLFIDSLRPMRQSAVVAYERDSANYLFGMTRFYYDSFPFKEHFPTKYLARNQITFKDLESSIIVMTAENVKAGRSRTLHSCHISEIGFWANPEASMTAIAQTIPNVPDSFVLIESTANGIGNWFEETWQESVAGRNEYQPFFFPWYRHYEYIPCEGTQCHDGTCLRCVEQSKGIRPRDSEEADLVKHLGVDLAHLAWRRWAIPNRMFGSVEMFHQEMPSTSDEAFLVSGVNAFPEVALREVFEPRRPAVGYLHADPRDGKISFKSDPAGPLRIYRWPSKDHNWGVYFIGADPSFGMADSDYAAAQVINRRNREQVAVWQGRINPYAFADELNLLGRFYNMAVVSPEVQGGGLGTVGRLIDLYPHIWQHRQPDRVADRQMSPTLLGFMSSWNRKAWAVTKLGEAIDSKQILLHDEATFKEMRSFVFYGGRGGRDVFEPASKDMNDDLVLALAIAVVCESVESPLEPYEMRQGIRPDGVIMPQEAVEEADGWAP